MRFTRQYGSRVVHDHDGTDGNGNVSTLCGRLLTDPAPDVNVIPGAMRHCADCVKAKAKADMVQAIRELRDEVVEYDKTTEWWGEGEDKGGDLNLSTEYSERLEEHAHGLASAAANLLSLINKEAQK
jgi:hypothetical protein